MKSVRESVRLSRFPQADCVIDRAVSRPMPAFLGGLGHRWLRRGQAILMGIAIGFGIVIFSSYWREIGVVQWQVNPLTFLASLFVLVSALSGWAWVWAWLVQQLGAPNASLFRLAAMMIQSNMTKYLPGALWNYFARSYFGHSEAVGQKSIWLANLLEIIAAIGTGFLLYGASLLWPHRRAHCACCYCDFLRTLIFCLRLTQRPGTRISSCGHVTQAQSLEFVAQSLLGRLLPVARKFAAYMAVGRRRVLASSAECLPGAKLPCS
jgi:hypothetical protein